MEKTNAYRYPCKVCGKKWRLSEMSKQLLCFACIGKAVIAGGKFGCGKRWQMEKPDLK
ncbi:MAG: hypothetical protein DDT29_00373 [Dehalococcoidia bacterium]|nr:hypothetical protein [Bacillota bacterium]